MKTPIIYGAFVALAMAVWTLVQFFLGWHGDNIAMSAKLNFINWLVWAGVGVIGMFGARAAQEPGTGFSYGRAVGSGVMATLAFSVLSGLFTIIYMMGINPGFGEALTNFQAEMLSQKGVPAEGIEGMRKVMGFMLNPFVMFGMNLILPQFFGIVPSLLAAIFARREAAPVNVAA